MSEATILGAALDLAILPLATMYGSCLAYSGRFPRENTNSGRVTGLP